MPNPLIVSFETNESFKHFLHLTYGTHLIPDFLLISLITSQSPLLPLLPFSTSKCWNASGIRSWASSLTLILYISSGLKVLNVNCLLMTSPAKDT